MKWVVETIPGILVCYLLLFGSEGVLGRWAFWFLVESRLAVTHLSAGSSSGSASFCFG